MVKPCLITVALLLAGCTQSGLEDEASPRELDANFFRCQVQPVLAARCAFMACHGNDERLFQVFAEQRYRLEVDWDEFETPLSDEELAANFKAARALVAPTNLLSEKALDTRAGGLFHRGKDLFGSEDVFLTSDDPGYLILRAFGEGSADTADCVPTEEVGP